MPKKSKSELSPPILSEVSDCDLGIESHLRDLPLYYFYVEVNTLCYQVTDFFEKYRSITGAILLKNGEFIGMIYRQRLLEYLIRHRAIELF